MQCTVSFFSDKYTVTKDYVSQKHFWRLDYDEPDEDAMWHEDLLEYRNLSSGTLYKE